jgi:hypothetical protein
MQSNLRRSPGVTANVWTARSRRDRYQATIWLGGGDYARRKSAESLGIVVSEPGNGTVAKRRPVVAAVMVGTCLLVSTACGSSASEAPRSNATAAASSGAQSSVAPTETEAFKGTYRVDYDDGLASTWTATPCGQGCVDVALLSEDSTARILEGQADLKGGKWSMSIWSPDDTICSDGREIAGISVWTWDSSTLDGELAATPGDVCANGLPTPGVPFTMTK